jgi:hypothetical protein
MGQAHWAGPQLAERNGTYACPRPGPCTGPGTWALAHGQELFEKGLPEGRELYFLGCKNEPPGRAPSTYCPGAARRRNLT